MPSSGVRNSSVKPPHGQDVDQGAVHQPLIREASAELNKIENVVRAILEHDSPSWRKYAPSSIRWTPISALQQLQYHTFRDINDVMHLARGCCEIGDVTSLIAIQKAFREAWVFRQIKPQPETLSVANAIWHLNTFKSQAASITDQKCYETATGRSLLG
jgi:hypothetical protein